MTRHDVGAAEAGSCAGDASRRTLRSSRIGPAQNGGRKTHRRAGDSIPRDGCADDGQSDRGKDAGGIGGAEASCGPPSVSASISGAVVAAAIDERPSRMARPRPTRPRGRSGT